MGEPFENQHPHSEFKGGNKGQQHLKLKGKETNLLEEYFLECKDEEPKPPKLFEKNDIPDFFFSFLRSRDDNLVLLTLLLINSALKSHNGSPEVLAFCGFGPSQNEKNQKREKLFRDVLKLLDYEPPFRLATCLIACKTLCLIAKETKGTAMSPQNKKIMGETYLKRLQNIISLVENPKKSRETIEILEQEFTKEENFVGVLERNHPIENQMSHKALVMVQENGKEELSCRLPANQEETMRIETKLFLMLKATISTLLSNKESGGKPMEAGDFFSSCSKYLEETSTKDWKKGMEIDKNTKIQKVKCSLAMSQDHMDWKKSKGLFLALVPDIFCLLKLKEKSQKLEVFLLLEYKQILVLSFPIHPKAVVVRKTNDVKPFLTSLWVFI